MTDNPDAEWVAELTPYAERMRMCLANPNNDTYQEAVKGATHSDCGFYRYRLWRAWSGGPRMTFIMLNPSIADASKDDPTIRRCIGFAKREGFDGIEVLNLYALRATNPLRLLDHPDPEGPENARTWQEVLVSRAGPVVAAWGASAPFGISGSFAQRLHQSCSMLCLGTTQAGHPRHPLYVRADQPLVPYDR